MSGGPFGPNRVTVISASGMGQGLMPRGLAEVWNGLAGAGLHCQVACWLAGWSWLGVALNMPVDPALGSDVEATAPD